MAQRKTFLKLHSIFNKAISSHFLASFSSKLRLNSTYSAACLTDYGKPLVIEQFKRLPLKTGEVRVDVQYCSLNFNDVKYLERPDDYEKKLPFVPGYELSGEIIEVGESCDVNVGDRIVGLIRSGHGGLATEAVLGQKNVWKLDSDVPYADAAALISSHSTAMLAFTEYAPINEEDTVLVIAGAGGYGLAAVEVASTIFKAKVIAVSDTDGKACLLRDRGAFAAFKNDLKRNYKEIMKATEDKGINYIYDAVGGPILNTVVKCMGNSSKGVILGTYRLRMPKNNDSDDEKENKSDKNEDSPDNKNKKENKDSDEPVKLSQEVIDKFKNVNIFNYQNVDQVNYYNLIRQILEYYEEDLVTAYISKTFKLNEINEAINYIKGKMCTGKVLIKIKDT